MSNQITTDMLMKAIDVMKQNNTQFGGVYLHKDSVLALDEQTKKLLDRAEKAEAENKMLRDAIIKHKSHILETCQNQSLKVMKADKYLWEVLEKGK